MRLFYRLLFILSALTLLPLLFISTITYINARQHLQQNAINGLTTITNLEISDIDRWLEANGRILRSLAQRPLVRQYTSALLSSIDLAEMRRHPLQEVLINDHLGLMLQEEDSFFELFILDAETGIVISSTSPEQFGKDRQAEPYFTAGKTETTIQEIRYSISHDRSLITIATPMRDRDGRLIAVLAGHLDLNVLSEVLAAGSSNSRTQESYLVTNANLFVTETRADMSPRQQRAAYSPGIDACLQGENGSGTYDNYQSDPVIGHYQWLPQMNLCIVTEIGAAEALAPALNLRNRTILISGLTGIVVILAAGIFARSITNPVEKLVAGTEAIGRGELDFALSGFQNDELGRLAAAFNEMNGRLRQSQEQLTTRHMLNKVMSQVDYRIRRSQGIPEIIAQMVAPLQPLNINCAFFQLLPVQPRLELLHVEISAEIARLLPHFPQMAAARRRFPLPPDGLFAQALQKGEPLYIPRIVDVFAEIGRPEAMGELETILETNVLHHACIIPTFSHEETSGMLVITRQGMQEADLPVYAVLAQKVGVALENGRLLEQLIESEEKFRMLALNIADGVAILVDEKLYWLNHAFQRIFGYRENELLGKEFSTILTPVGLQLLQSQIKQTAEGPAYPQWFVLPAQKSNGEAIYIEGKGKAIQFEDLPAQQIIVTDVTARVEAETALRRHRDELEDLVAERTAALQEREKLYRALAESSPDLIFLIDSEFNFRYVNQATAKLYQQNQNAIVGQSNIELLGPHIGQLQRETLQKVIASRAQLQTINPLPMQGRELWLQTRFVPIFAPDGETVEAVLGISRDISTLKQVELDLQEKATALEESNQELQQFAYVASHDLQEPLRMVSSFLSLLEMELGEDLSAEAKQYIWFAGDGARRMSALVTDLLSFSRVTSHGQPFVEVDTAVILAETLRDLQATIQEKNALVTADKLPVITGDPTQFKQVLQNLISNGLKFHQQTVPKIHIGVQYAPEKWTFSVKDNGIGIDPKHQERIFIIFQRLHTREQFPGTGIGLAICRKIVNRHGGEIWFKSNGKEPGTTFYFSIAKI